MAIKWQQVLDEHRSRVQLGDLLRLYVDPNISGGKITYDACVYDLNLSLIIYKQGFTDIPTAQQEALRLAAQVLRTTMDEVSAELARIDPTA